MKLMQWTLAGALCVSALAAHADLNDGLVAYYPFNGNAIDATMNGNDGTVVNATLCEDKDGNPNSAYFFDGWSYISLAMNNLPVGNSERTVSALVSLLRAEGVGNVVSYGTAASWQTFGLRFSRRQAFAGVPAPWVGLMGFDTGGTGADYAARTRMTEGRWGLATFTYKDRHLDIYINDTLVASHDFPQDHVTGTTAAYIGKSIHNVAEWPMRGYIDEVRFYNRALSSAEVTELYRKYFP